MYQQVYDHVAGSLGLSTLFAVLPPAIGAAAVGMGGRERDLLRRVVVWSIVLVLLMCVIVHLQSTSVLSWMAL